MLAYDPTPPKSPRPISMTRTLWAQDVLQHVKQYRSADLRGQDSVDLVHWPRDQTLFLRVSQSQQQFPVLHRHKAGK